MPSSEKTRAALLKDIKAVFGPYCGEDRCPALMDDLLRRLNEKAIEVTAESEIDGCLNLTPSEFEEMKKLRPDLDVSGNRL